MRWPVLCLPLTACAAVSISPLANDLGSMKGQPVQAAFARLGYPDRQEVIAGRPVYFWGDDKSACSIKLVATPDDRVDSGSVYGSPAGCYRFHK